jgi:hypothetical protein
MPPWIKPRRNKMLQMPRLIKKLKRLSRRLQKNVKRWQKKPKKR